MVASAFTPLFHLPQWAAGPPGVGDPISRAEFNQAYLDIENKALPVVCTSGTRPSSPMPGQLIYETDTRFLYQRNAANSLWVMIGNIPSVSSTGAITTPFTGQVVFVTTGNVFYRYTGSVWSVYSVFTHSLAATVSTPETTTATSYADLATVGPTVTITSVGTTALVLFGCKAFTNSAVQIGHAMSIAVSGATTNAASDAYAWQGTHDNSGFGNRGMSFVQLTITPGANTYTAKYRLSAATSSTFQDRRIWVYAP